MPAGRPLKFQSVEELQQKIDAFFLECDAKDYPYTITGLALALDTTRESLCDYEDKPEFSDTVKRAKQRVQNYAEKRLFTGQPAGPIFALKNFGWTDKTQQELSGPNGGAIPLSLEVHFVEPQG